MPPVLSVGVRYQRAPSKRSARAFSTPEVSAPASGWPPMKRLSDPSAAITSRFTEPTSVIAQSSPAAARASAATPGRAVTGAAQKTTSAPTTASAAFPAGSSIASSCAARSSSSRSGSKPATSAPSLWRAASPTEPPIRPTPRTAIRIGPVSAGLAPLPHRRGEPVEGQDGVVPVHAGVGDRLAVDERLAGLEVLAPGDEERLHHHADDGAVARGELVGNLADHLGLALVILAAVVVRGVDHHPLGEPRRAELVEGLAHRVSVVVRRGASAAENDVTVLVPLGVEDRRGTADVDARERVGRGSRANRVDRELDAPGRAVLEADRHRQARGKLTVDLALRRPSPDRSPRHDIGDVLRRDRVEELAASREAEVGHLEQQPAGGVETDVHVPRAVEVRIVDQPLPARRRPRLLEVDAHRDAEVAAQVRGLRRQPPGVFARGLRVVDAARTDDDQEPVVLAVEDRLHLGAMAKHRVLPLPPQRLILQDLGGRDQLDDALDALVSDAVRVLSRYLLHLEIHPACPFFLLVWRGSWRAAASRSGSCTGEGLGTAPGGLRFASAASGSRGPDA